MHIEERNLCIVPLALASSPPDNAGFLLRNTPKAPLEAQVKAHLNESNSTFCYH